MFGWQISEKWGLQMFQWPVFCRQIFQAPQNVVSWKNDKYHVRLIYWVIEKSLRSVLGKLCQAAGWCNGWAVRNKGGGRRELWSQQTIFRREKNDNIIFTREKRITVFFRNCSPLCFHPRTGPSTFQLRNKGGREAGIMITNDNFHNREKKITLNKNFHNTIHF